MLDREEERAQDPPVRGSQCQEGSAQEVGGKPGVWRPQEVTGDGEGARDLPVGLLTLQSLPTRSPGGLEVPFH